MNGVTYPCGDPCVSFTDATRHTSECVRCQRALQQPWTDEDEARVEQSRHPIITHPREDRAVTTTTTKTPAERIAQAKAEILADIEAGRVPATVSTFAELHDYVDANEYGGLCDDETWAGVDNDTPEYAALVELGNEVQDAVNAWLMNGRPMRPRPAVEDGTLFESPNFPDGQRVEVDSLEPGDVILTPVWGTPRQWVARRIVTVHRTGSDRSRVRVTFPLWSPPPAPSESSRTFAPFSTVWKVATS